MKSQKVENSSLFLTDNSGQHLHKNLTIKERIGIAEPLMLEMPQVSCPVRHYFSDGICIREVFLPAGSFVIGHHQNFAHLNNFIQGKVLMLSDDETVNEISAPMTFIGNSGRKIGYILEDVIWQNIYATNEKDVEKVENIFLTKSDDFKKSFECKNSIKLIEGVLFNEDYLDFLEEYELSEKEVRDQSEDESDQIPFPNGSYKIKVGNSKIEGKGIISMADIYNKEIIAPARINGKRTPAGRYTNHSMNPNSMMIKRENGDIDLVAIKNILGCQGGFDGEEITVDYRQVLSENRRLI